MAISSDRASVGRVRLRWAATILLTGCALAAAVVLAPDVLARRTGPAHETSMQDKDVPAPVTQAQAQETAAQEAKQAKETEEAEAAEAAEEKAMRAELTLPGELPASGTGIFVGAGDGGPLLGGERGQLKRVRVAVESELTAELDGLVAAVDTTLGDPRSWVAGGAYRFQRVPYAAPHDFTIYLVTRETAFRMCRVNGVDIRVNGVPYTSCRQVGQVVINLDRWRLSVPSYVDSRVPLRLYRAYVLNHEVGHELGRGHVGCPAAGSPAPVMLPQTLGLQGCAPNSWPHPDGAS
jgi:Protein of unknown function (DUF3152)